jgi:4-amino-4-deoxy-L-arabinose transferase-like glycosyltransferase
MPDAPPPHRPTFTTKHWLIAIVLLGAVLRFVPIWFGLPFHEARPDEETSVGHALAVLDGDFNPHFFHWPSLTFYLFAAIYAVAAWIKGVIDFQPVLTPNQLFIIGRAVVAAGGTLTIVVLFSLTRRIAGDMTALVAAFFLAVATLHVRESHFAMTDVLMTLLVTLSMALLLRAFDDATQAGGPGDRALRGFAAAGLACGLAASTKYSGGAVAAAMVAVQCSLALRARHELWRMRVWMPSVAFAAAAAFGFLAATPYALLDYRSFAEGLAFDVTHLSGGHGIDLGVGWIYHVTRSLPVGLSVTIFAAAIAGAVSMARRHGRTAFVVGVFCAAFYAAIAGGYTVFFRYVLPLVPFLCLLAAAAVSDAGEWLARRTGFSRGATVAVIAALIGVPALVSSTRFDLLLSRTDSRVLAGRWLGANVKPEESLYDTGGTYAQASLLGVDVHVWAVGTFDEAANSFRGAGSRIPDWLVLPRSPLIYTSVPAGLQRLADEKYEVVHRVDATREGIKDGNYDPQDAFFLPVTGFGSVLRPGPTILIYRRRAEVKAS